VVTDASGKPVSGLGEKDFTLLDHDTPQSIATFQEVAGRSASGRAHIVLLIDAVNNSFADVARERRAVDAFLRQNNGKLSYPVSLTMLSDSGVRKIDASTDGNLLADELRDQFPRPGRFSFNGGPSGGNQRFLLSIQALRRLAADERNEPGRAILVWMGQGWPTLTDPGYEAATFEDKRAYFDALVQLSTALRIAQVTINNVLPAGAGQPEGGTESSRVHGVRRPEEAEAEDLSLATMVQMTGGKSLHQGKDFVAEIAACVVDAESYYRLSFDPQAANQPNELRFLTVKLDRPELASRTYRLYYAQP
jgi:VWFA-related protein